MNGRDHRYFQRLAALLLSLAGLAERAGNRCLAVRWLVLWILRPAEAAALAYAIETAGSAFLLFGCQRTGNTPEDAAHLAESLRRLAAVFTSLAHRARLAQASAPRAPFHLSQLYAVVDCLRTLVSAPARHFDTS